MAADLQRKGYAAKTIGIKLRYEDFKIATRDQTAATHTDDARAIRRLAGLCLKRVPLDQRLRLLGVRAGSLVKTADRPSVKPDQAGSASAPAPQQAPGWVNSQLF